MSDETGLQLKSGYEAALDTVSAEAAALKAACGKAYFDHPNSCSHAVNYVIRQIHGLSELEWPQRQANLLIDFLVINWAEVSLERAYELAQKGVVVVGGKKESGHGHVIAVFPGLKRPRGGYDYQYQGRLTRMREDGSYPLALSTSNGSWPGAMSCGDKTVWDPWGKDQNFSLVKFWTRKTDASVKANVAAMVTSRRYA